MGESLLESPKVDNKMGESVTNVPCFQQSVSFGRFERDTLCWERWSTFPTNKYLDEVEKCSTPGSVAQKKAYFEAHYKKIAARRAELLLDQEREREAELVESEDSASANLICNTSEKDLDDERTDTDDSVSETDQQEDEVGSFDHGCTPRGLISPPSDRTIGSGTVSVSEGELAEQSALYENPVPFCELEPVSQTESNAELCNTCFDAEVSVEHVHVKSNSADMFCQDNEVGNFVDEVTVEHVCGKTDSADVYTQENDVQDRPSKIIEHDGTAFDVYEVSKLSNVVNELCENLDEYKSGDNTIDEASEDMDIEVTKEICEVNDCANVIDKTMKIEVADQFEYSDDGTDLIKGNNSTQPQEEFVSADLCRTSKNRDGKLKLPNTPSILKSKGEELPQEKVKRTVVEEKSRNLMKLVTAKKTQKATLVKKTVSSTNTKKQSPTPVPKRTSSPMPKSTMLSSPKSSEPELSKGAKSAGRLLDKKENGFTPPATKKTTGPQSRRLIPTSLHMSLSLGPMNSDEASLTMRKSLIMERMGDKDIVKRAFKAFQNTSQTSSASLAKSPVPNQSVTRKAEQKGSPATIIPNRNEGIGKAAKTANTRTSQQGIRKTLLFPNRVNKNGGADQRNVKSVAASFGPRVLLQGKSQNEVSKKLELQANTNVSGTTPLLSKHKVGKAGELKKSSCNINTKPKPPPSYGHKHGGSLHKEDVKAKAAS